RAGAPQTAYGRGPAAASSASSLPCHTLDDAVNPAATPFVPPGGPSQPASPLPQRPHTPAGLAHSQPHQQPLPHQLYQQPHPQRPVPLSATAPAGNPNPAGANGLVSQMGQMGIHDQAAPHKPRPRRVYPTDPGAHPGGSASPVRPVTPQSGPHQQQQQHPSYQPQALTPGYSPATAMHGQQLSSARYPQQQQQQPLPPPQQAQSQLFTPAAATTAFGQAPPPPYPRAAPHPQHSQQPSAVPAEPPKPRINPDQMPSPVAVHAHDQEMFSTEPYVTSQKTNVPMVSTRYRTIDEGNCNPRFMRMSAYNVPVSEGLQNTAKIPIGLLVQPLARLEPGEEPIQVVDFSEEGPIRCARCKSYINPYYTFVNGGKSFVCNICRHENDVPSDYFCNLDMSGRRLDWETRPELRHGSIEFLATKDFISRPPVPASYVFAIDVSWQSIQSRMLEACVTAIKDILYGGEGLPPLTKFGLITYDRHVHFYNLSSSLEQAQMLTVPDIDDVFVPLHDGLCVDPYESREVIEDLLDRLPGL
ncbi:COPII coat Sec23p-Sfb3p heterodimer component, partial [Spiromyces aspiralis]